MTELPGKPLPYVTKNDYAKWKPPARKKPLCGISKSCSNGHTIERIELHLRVERFLAELRNDRAWERACRKAMLELEEVARGEEKAPLALKETA